jgi:hypothetical protein
MPSAMVSPFQGCPVESSRYPGRRLAADAAALCPGLACCGLSGQESRVRPSRRGSHLAAAAVVRKSATVLPGTGKRDARGVWRCPLCRPFRGFHTALLLDTHASRHGLFSGRRYRGYEHRIQHSFRVQYSAFTVHSCRFLIAYRPTWRRRAQPRPPEGGTTSGRRDFSTRWSAPRYTGACG